MRSINLLVVCDALFNSSLFLSTDIWISCTMLYAYWILDLVWTLEYGCYLSIQGYLKIWISCAMLYAYWILNMVSGFNTWIWLLSFHPGLLENLAMLILSISISWVSVCICTWAVRFRVLVCGMGFFFFFFLESKMMDVCGHWQPFTICHRGMLHGLALCWPGRLALIES